MKNVNDIESIKILDNIVNINSDYKGIEYLNVLIEKIAVNLDLKCVLIGHYFDDSFCHIQTDAIYYKKKHIDNIKYEIKGSPCESVIANKNTYVFEKNVCISFPEDKLLQKMNIESYVGVPIYLNENAEISFILVLLDDFPIENKDFILVVTNFISKRISYEISKYNSYLDFNKKLHDETYKIELSQQRLSKKLNIMEDKSEKFFNVSSNIMVISDFEGKIININRSVYIILGYEPKEIINTSFLDLVHPDDLKKTINEIADLNNKKVTYYFENRYRHKDGTYKTLAWSADVNIEGRLIYASAQDVTETKNKDKIIFQQSKFAAMGEMIDNIAHQWRQPLSIISTEVAGIKLKNELELLNKHELNEHISDINYSLQYLSQTIDDFRNFFRKDKTNEQFNIFKTINSTNKLLSAKYKLENIKVIKNLLEIDINGFKNELVQVFLNILNNSIFELSRIKLKEKYIFIDVFRSKNKIIICFKDNAGGIDENIISNVFEPIFTTKQNDGGTGIGLYMSKIIICDHMHGTINVKNSKFTYNNETYNGAEFIITFPLNQLP